MKQLINIIKVFHYVCAAIFIATIYALFTRGWEWIFFSAISGFMAVALKQEYKEMEESIYRALSYAEKEITRICDGPGKYTAEYLFEGNWYYIDFEYKEEYDISRGAEFIGDYEMVATLTNAEYTITGFDCINDLTGEPADCGFTIEDIQDMMS